MDRSLFLMFNHEITVLQEEDARESLGVSRIANLPPELQELWSNIPPDLPEIAAYLRPLKHWLASNASPGDFVLIQGDFGACCLMVRFALEHGLVPVYSTTAREAEEEPQPDGSVRLVHHFRHVIYRRYEEPSMERADSASPTAQRSDGQ